ncbi:MAG: alpha-galactosidase, partial [Clostridia bacterium]
SINDERLTVKVNDIAAGARIEIYVDLKGEVEFEKAKLFLYQRYDEKDKIFANGYQSWTRTCEKSIDEKDKELTVFAKLSDSILHLRPYGDYNFYDYTHKRGNIHSHNYTYIRKGNDYTLFGALTDDIGFTIFETDVKNSTMNVITDIKGLVCHGRRKLFDFIIVYGDKNTVFDRFFAEQNVKLKTKEKLKGFTSWYNYYQDINEEIIDRNIDNFIEFRNKGFDVNMFQIDDGFETFVGDWLSIDKAKFPNGLIPLAKKINQNFKSGLWLAPFVCETKSEMFQNHKEWILKDDNGNLVHAGHNWSGFYALDIYNEKLQDHLEKVFDTVFNVWNFDLVKLDFLYAACLHPPKNKTRGEVMRDGMKLLRKWCGDKLILGCGVPLSSAYGLVEYCRIGCDISLDYTGGILSKIIHNECVSSHDAILDTIYRDPLNGRAFMNDPDVFLLRDDNIKMNKSEKELVATVNALFGSVLFTSDDFSKYQNKETLDKLRQVWELNSATNIKIEYQDKERFLITYELDGERDSVLIDAKK